MKKFIEKINENSEINAEFIKELSFEISLPILNRLDKNAKISKFSELFMDFSKDLSELNLINDENIKALFDGIKHAFIKDDEEYLYKLINDSDRIRREIMSQKDEIKNTLFATCQLLENAVNQSEFGQNLTIKKAINDKMLDETMMKEFLKEISETAFLSAIENVDDVEGLSYEMSKRIVYNSVIQGEYHKEVFLKVLNIVIGEAINVANASQIYTKELISGAVFGAYDGLVKAMEKFKNDYKFSPISPNIDFLSADDEIENLLKQMINLAESPAKDELEILLDKNFDNYFVKFKRLATTAVKSKLEDSQISEKIENMLTKSKEIRENLEINAKFEGFKSKIVDFEKDFLSKFKNLNKKD